MVLINWLRKTRKPSAIVIFSGDVHYRSEIRGGYRLSDGASEYEDWKLYWETSVIQITSSPIKNTIRIL